MLQVYWMKRIQDFLLNDELSGHQQTFKDWIVLLINLLISLMNYHKVALILLATQLA